MFVNFSYIYQKIYDLFFGRVLGGDSFFAENLIYLKFFLIFLNIFLAVCILYIAMKIFKIRAEEIKELIEHTVRPGQEEPEKKESAIWKKITTLADSDNSSDWKLAIIEADKALDNMLSVIGYQGDGVGDKLMGVESGDFLSLDDAWEAHKIRNKIAHQSDFNLPEREVKRVIGLYEKAFREFDYI